ncbi:hypothetical protein BDR05DRAFT_993227 [Suillus weaverae]|nr:hypothetical protein BDR05DRAFT_993227 [Suillus weaverae]
MAPAADDHIAILAGISLSFVAVTALRRFFKKQQNKPPLPPSPVSLPLLGSVLSGAAYGDLVFVRILDEEVIVVNSQHITEALLDKHSRIYSDRPYLATLEPARDDPLVQIMIKALIPGLTLLTPGRTLMLKTFLFFPDIDSTLAKADSSVFAQSSMVAENLRRMEIQEEVSKPAFENALKQLLLLFLVWDDVQKRAQTEIDSVIGRDWLPTFEDRASLPYVDAVVRETFR